MRSEGGEEGEGEIWGWPELGGKGGKREGCGVSLSCAVVVMLGG